MNEERTAALQEKVSRLDFHEPEREFLLEQLSRIEPKHGFRGLLFQGSDENVRKHLGSAAAERFKDFMSGFEPPKRFAMGSAQTFFLMNACAASLWSPWGRYADGAFADVRAWVQEVSENPIMQLLRTGFERNLAELFLLEAEAVQRLTNFGEIRAQAVSSHEVQLRLEDNYAALFAPVIAGAAAGVLELAQVKGEVHQELDPDLDEALVSIRW
ncbi:MAG: hypothetical protein RBU37_12310 [Myxococcota bacterium]|jgi:uncharacterized protein (TIGR02265 family)|nr:hypothetical protein [Myxococcota bacterium]